jgi:hypothetical protein
MTQLTQPAAPASERFLRRQEQCAQLDQAALDRCTDAVLARYLDSAGRRREVLVRPGLAGSLLVVDRDCKTRADHRLLAHLPPDEPVGNAALVCRHYLHDPPRRRCRALIAEDVAIVPFAREAEEVHAAAPSAITELHDRQGRVYRLEPQEGVSGVPQLRWSRTNPGEQPRGSAFVSVREVIGSLESYRPVRTLTLAALARNRDAQQLSLTRLRAELELVSASRIVLNRGLRSAVLRVTHSQGLSFSEIAIRCGRVKYDVRGHLSGETSWLARRVGLAPEGGRQVITPWVHTDVLALIARDGLGLSPHEVEVD